MFSESKRLFPLTGNSIVNLFCTSKILIPPPQRTLPVGEWLRELCGDCLKKFIHCIINTSAVQYSALPGSKNVKLRQNIMEKYLPKVEVIAHHKKSCRFLHICLIPVNLKLFKHFFWSAFILINSINQSVIKITSRTSYSRDLFRNTVQYG